MDIQPESRLLLAFLQLPKHSTGHIELSFSVHSQSATKPNVCDLHSSEADKAQSREPDNDQVA